MSRFQFGIGGLFANPVGGNLGSPSGPQWFGTLQDVNIDIDQKLVELRGQYKFPDDVAPSDMSIKGKSAFGRLDIGLFNSTFYGDSITTGAKIAAQHEAHVIGAASLGAWNDVNAYTLGQVIDDGINLQIVVEAGTSGAVEPTWDTVLGGLTVDDGAVWQNIGPAANSVAVTNVADYDTDLGVIFKDTGITLVKVSSSPAAGQYSTSAGAYTFNVADAGKTVLISYVYETATGKTLLVTNRVQGYGPVFELWLREPYQGENGLHFFRCRSSKLDHPLKRDGYKIPNFEFMCYPNAAGEVYEEFELGL